MSGTGVKRGPGINRNTVKGECPPELIQARVGTQFTTDRQPEPEVKSLGGRVRAWKTEMAMMTEDELRAIEKSRKEPAARRGCAKALLLCMDDARHLLAETGDSDGLPIARSQNEHHVHVAPAVAMTQDQIDRANDLARRANHN